MRTIMVWVVALVMVIAVSGTVWAETATTAPATTGTTASLVNLELRNVTVAEGIRALFQDRGVAYIVTPGVGGRIVELTLKGVTFDQAVKAFFDAAELTYVLEEGMYIISPAKPAPAAGQTAQRSTTGQDRTAQASQREAQTRQGSGADEALAGENQPATAQPTSVVAPNTSVYVNQNAPVVYGHPSGLGIVDTAGYYGPNLYRAGNVRFIYGWPPVVLGSDMPYVLNFGQGPPPPPGWVSPDMLRLLRAQWAFQSQPYFITPY